MVAGRCCKGQESCRCPWRSRKGQEGCPKQGFTVSATLTFCTKKARLLVDNIWLVRSPAAKQGRWAPREKETKSRENKTAQRTETVTEEDRHPQHKAFRTRPHRRKRKQKKSPSSPEYLVFGRHLRTGRRTTTRARRGIRNRAMLKKHQIHRRTPSF